MFDFIKSLDPMTLLAGSILIVLFHVIVYLDYTNKIKANDFLDRARDIWIRFDGLVMAVIGTIMAATGNL